MKATDLIKETIAGMMDAALLGANATPKQIEDFCKTATKYGFYTIDINSNYVALAKKVLAKLKSPVKILSTVSFPLGQASTKAKVAEARSAFADGSDEVDMVLNVGRFVAKDYNYVLREIKEVVKQKPTKKNVVKVILETGFLTNSEIVKACNLVVKSGADFVKTGTGFVKKATVADVRLLRKTVGPDFGVKAAGGIRTPQQAIALIKAGANRIASSHAKELIDAIR